MEFIATFKRLFNFRDEKSVGRSVNLLYTLLFNLANVFITGTFYTGFLINNGIDIVKVGIITFIPYFCWIFSLFGPRIMQRFKSRRGIMIFNHVFYYSCIVLGTTVMPMFVEDPDARTLWFAIFLVIGNISSALFGSGSSAWMMNFHPEGNDLTSYFSITYLVTNLSNMVMALVASVLADALAGSPAQAQVIVTMRYVSYAVIIIAGLLVYLVPKEYPYPISEKKYSLRDILVQPVQNKAFFYTILIAVFWNFICNMNAGTWTYYVLNTVGMSYMLTYTCTIALAVGGIFLTSPWRRIINRYGWQKMLVVNVLLSGVVEVMCCLFGPESLWLYVVGQIITGINLIGAQINFATVPYANLPKKDPDIYLTFYSFIVNLGVFAGSALGTWLLARLEQVGTGIGMYGSQLLVLVKAAGYLAMGIYLWRVMPVICAKQKENSSVS